MVIYFKRDDYDGQLFECERRDAVLSPNSCAVMWSNANGSKSCPINLTKCHNCPVGAHHSGCDVSGSSQQLNLCARCNRPSVRMVRDRICISCANREYEVLRGVNARGCFPSKHPPLHKISIRYRYGGSVILWGGELVTNSVEAMMSVIKICGDEVEFSFGSAAGGLK